MSVGHMRREGFRTAQDRFIWSNPPRYPANDEDPHMPPTCVSDLLGGALLGSAV